MSLPTTQAPPTSATAAGPTTLPPPPPSQSSTTSRLPPPPPATTTGHVPGTVPSHAPGWNDLPHSEILSRNASTVGDAVAQDELRVKLEAIMAGKREAGSIPDRVFKDCEKRMGEILDKLREHRVPGPLAVHLSVLVDAFNAGNADEVARELQALSMTFVDEAKWIVGLRRLLQ